MVLLDIVVVLVDLKGVLSLRAEPGNHVMLCRTVESKQFRLTTSYSGAAIDDDAMYVPRLSTPDAYSDGLA